MTLLRIKITLLFVFSFFFSGCNKDNTVSNSSENGEIVNNKLNKKPDLVDNISYSLGYTMGKSLSNKNLSTGDTALSYNEIIEGFRSATLKKKSKFSTTEMRDAVVVFYEKIVNDKTKIQKANIYNHLKEIVNINDFVPHIGPKNAKIVIIELFDYQCYFCHKLAPYFKKIMDANPNIQYIFKEYPILGERWKSSYYASELGTAISFYYGNQKYLEYHNNLFKSGLEEGKLTKIKIKDIATKIGVDVKKMDEIIKQKSISKYINDNVNFFRNVLSIAGTPTTIIIPTEHTNKDDITIISGFQPEKIQQSIEKYAKFDVVK